MILTKGDKMTLNEFEKLLKEAKLSKKEFAKITNMNYNSVINWGTKNTYAGWVEPFLQNHIKAKKYDDLIKSIVNANK